MARPARIAVLKPDFGVAGGFERVVNRVEMILGEAGHETTRVLADMRPATRSIDDLVVPPEVWDSSPEYFGYVAGRTRFDRLDTTRFDLVVSTQPPSFGHRHRRHLALFYHHHRVFYDLADHYVEAGFAKDPEVHAAATAHVRRLDQPRLEAVGHFLTPSDTVAGRLARFNGLVGTGRFLAGVGVDAAAPDDSIRAGSGPVLCVGRHEFPKRCELLVAAAHLLDGPKVHVVGTGGRLAFARDLDKRLAAGEIDPSSLGPGDLWLNTATLPRPEPVGGVRSPVRFSGWIDDGDLTAAYRSAPCVVAPAFDEDYGLTAIEAMAHGRPVVVCNDGGGLAELVDHERTGLVVDPTPQALAAGITRLVEDGDLAAALGRNAIDRARELTWRNAATQLREGVDLVLAS